MKLEKQFSDPCIQSLLSRRWGCPQNYLDMKIADILKEDNKRWFDHASKKASSFSLSSFQKYLEIERCLSDYILLIVLNDIYRDRINKNQWLFSRAVSALGVENIVDAVIKTRITKEHTYKFVDKGKIDYVIESRKTGSRVACIQCKALLEIGRSVLSETKLLKQLQETNRDSENKNARCALFCGCFSFPKKIKMRQRRKLQKKTLQKYRAAKWPIFLVFEDAEEYQINHSIHDFIKFIEDIT